MKILNITLLSALILGCGDTIADEDIQGNTAENSTIENSAAENSGKDSEQMENTATKSSEHTKIKKPTFGDIPAPPDVSAPPADATTTASGLVYKTLVPGDNGERPTAESKVEVHYTGWTTDGKMFDSSAKRGVPAKFPLNKVIAGWTEGVQLMTVGEKTRFWIPEALAYKGRAGAPAGMLVFDIELLSFKTPPPPPETPKNVDKPPRTATKTSSGLAYKLLSKGSGTENPTEESVVTVHYTGWLTNGEMFDSSVTRDEPAKFPLNKVIAGWTEGLQLMNEGDKMRFWIPEDLAYKGRAGAPAGMLVFDVELLTVFTPPPPPEVPIDVAAAPIDAIKTSSGLAYKVLAKGSGAQKPTSTSVVKVHYTGWMTNGEMFDSSVARGEPAEFPLNRVISGWTEGLQLMSPGDKVRFWIPEDLAYKGRPGAPAGMLVFDVELLEIVK